MNISYLITCSSEETTLKNLLYKIKNYKDDDDEIVVILDAGCNNNENTKKILREFGGDDSWYYTHLLNKNYSEHKNYGATLCKNPWIMQVDGDEVPTEDLLLNIKDLIKSNPDIEAFWIPRINDYVGNYDKIAIKWGWRLSPSKTVIHEKTMDKSSNEYIFLKNNGYIITETEKTVQYRAVLVNAYDPQCRLFLNDPTRIKWEGKLHERIVGNKNYVFVPDVTETLALYHYKTIERQIATNLMYNSMFTKQENMGFRIPK